MVECSRRNDGSPIDGIVIAYAELEKKGKMIDYGDSLSLSGERGEIFFNDTRDILDGGTIWIEFHDITRE
jgi:hypothetical protein